ncbi:metallophosphoesterase [Crocinitomix algicola]|uniref:metallophosphoesterase n=1 Tax=Crocinitomix algicola TaxID=1740263 RepID=UPI00082B3121|nr:metallophosphoesterase [Crocinitomix algicola]
MNNLKLNLIKLTGAIALSCNFQIFAQQHSPSQEIQEESLDFFVIGDWGYADSNQRNVAGAMAKNANGNSINFIVSVGDNFYPNGVRSVRDKQWITTFENVYNHPSLQVNWYTALGNHDYMGKAKAQLKYNERNERWKTTERYFSFTQIIPGSTDSVLFVVIDTNPYDKSLNRFTSGLWLQNKNAQLEWFEETLAASTVKWKIVIGHHPLYTTGFRRGKMAPIRNIFYPYFEKYGVDVYLAGHDHDLQYQKPEGKTHYFVSGGGSEFRGVTRDSTITKFAAASLGFMRLNLKEDSLNVRFFNENNQELYQTIILK